MNREGLTLFLCFVFKKVIREQKRYKKRTQTSADTTIHDLRDKNKFENCVKDENIYFLNEALLFFFKQKYIHSWRRIILRFLRI